MIKKALITEEDPSLSQYFTEIFERQKIDLVSVKNEKEAIKRLQKESFDLVLSHLNGSKKSGLEILQLANQLYPPCLVIFITHYGHIEKLVEAIRLGAFLFLLKPFSTEIIEIIIKKAQEQSNLLKATLFLEQEKHIPIIAESPSMKRLLNNLYKIARSSASIFITGESGTGKEVIAEAIHQLSTRSNAPFIKVNCAAISDTLIESEFFGHERGSFTGAFCQKAGRFELADKGTLFLDEVTEIPIVLQPKLLRAIQEQEFERVGGTVSMKVNVRFIAASNRHIQEAVETKAFREDLYYRLNVVPIHIPPLRERTEDIIPLAKYFLKKFCLKNHKPIKPLTQEAMEKLLQYQWPGNVRELANIIERTVIFDNTSSIDLSHVHFSSSTQPLPPSFQVGFSLRELEKQLIIETLQTHNQNRSKTAAILGISIRTLRNKLHQYALNLPIDASRSVKQQI